MGRPIFFKILIKGAPGGHIPQLGGGVRSPCAPHSYATEWKCPYKNEIVLILAGSPFYIA